MGGRGAELNVDTYLNLSPEERTSEFHSVYQDGNIKFLKQNDNKPVNSPIFSNTEGRVYVVLSRDNKIHEITVYGKDHKRIFTIHPNHYNEKFIHEHISFPNRKKINLNDMKQSHLKLYNRVISLYNKNVKNIL